MYFKLFLVCLAILLCPSAFSQIIENVRARSDGDKINIQYDLKTLPKDSWVELRVFSSHNSFSIPLSNVSGAIYKVTRGVDQQIDWHYGHDLDNFNGDLSFEIETDIIFHLAFKSPKQSIRRGKNNVFTWSGGRPQDQVHFKLISSTSEVVWEAPMLNKTGTINLKPNGNLVLGKGYQIQLTSRDDLISIPIQVKRKVARFWLGAPIILAAGVVFYFFNADSNTSLPDAPGPPDPN